MTGRTRIAINGRFLSQPVTGVQRYAREMLHALDDIARSRTDLDIRLLTPRLDAPAPHLSAIRHEVVGRLRGHAWEQWDLPRHSRGDLLFCPGNTAPLLALLGRGQVAVTVHDLSYLYFPQAYSRSFRVLYQLIVPQVLRHADLVFTVSEAEKRAILEHYPEARDRLEAIQNGGLPAGTEFETHVAAAEPYVLYVGSLSKRKNLDSMLKVAVRLAEQRGLRFVFIGGITSTFKDSVLDIPPAVRDKLSFLGQVDDWQRLREHYRSATCFFFPSLYESSGLPPIEAMGCGCPVVAASIPALRERCGPAALYCDPTSVEDMTRTLERLLDDTQLQATLRAAGYKRAQEASWENCASAVLRLMVERLSRPS